MLSLKTGIYPKPGPQTHICVKTWTTNTYDICLKLITKHQISILCNYKKHWMHLKCSQITKDYRNSRVAHFTALLTTEHKQTQHHQRAF